MKRWTLKAIASVSGRAMNTVNAMALAGLAPGYKGNGVAPEVAEPFIVLMRNGAYTARLARVMREDPEEAIATGEALAELGRVQRAYLQHEHKAA